MLKRLSNNATPGTVIFIAIPTKGSALPDSIETGKLHESVYKTLAHLHTQYPEATFVCPMIQDYTLLKYLDKEPNWETWQNHCRRLIERSDAVWVLMLDGWTKPVATPDKWYNTSSGVAGEIRHAKLHNVPVSYLLGIIE